MSDDADFDEEIKRDFLAEVTGLLEQCEESYLKLESPSGRAAELGIIFRAVHSIKGAGAAVGFSELASFAHAVEDYLSLLRNTPDLVNASIISVLLRSGDEFKKCIRMLKSRDPSSWEIDAFKTEIKELTLRISTGKQITTSGPELEQKAPTKTSVLTENAPSGSIRVDAEKIESVLNLSGELLALKSQLDNHCKTYSIDTKLKYLLSLMDKSISEIHSRTLSMRMMPLKTLFLKTQRVIRDLSIKLSKPVEFEMSGETTEIDRTMVDLLGDPLMHIARNSLDHGIENTATRNDRGKSEKGTIHLSACQTGGRVTIKITDDGGGINREKIIKKAMEADLLSKTADPKSLTDRQVFNFLFAPGFSTAEKVTDVSGRGVGMDVVKTNIEKIKGIIDIETLEGLGTSLTISIPLTTAITEGMTFRIGSEFYIFPMDCIRQLIQVEMSDLIKIPSGQKIIKHRNKIYPFFRLEELFESKITSSDSMPKSLRLALIDTSKQVVAIKIDQVLGLVKAVLKPLTDDYKKSDGLSGAAVLASGQMSLVVDPIGLERIFAIQGIKNGNNG